MKVLVLGDGLLGSEIVRQTGWDFVSRKKDGIDFCDLKSYYKYLIDYDVIFNCIGCTDTYSNDRQKHWDINYKAVAELVDYCNLTDKKLIQPGTDYVYSNSIEDASEEDVPSNCANWYGYTKLLSDGYVQLRSKNYLLIRCSFRKNPFKYDLISTQIGNFDYVENIVKIIIELINKNADGVFNIGHEKWNIYDMAKQTNPNVEIRSKKIFDSIPDNVSMNINKMKEFLKNKN